MSHSPTRARRSSNEGYRPTIISTVGQRPACLVSASVTYVGNNEIYAFGGFDQFTDEVYNHVLRLNLDTKQWNLVGNYGDIPGVRMGHTASLWRGDQVLIFGGENEFGTYLNDFIIFDLKTAHWRQPDLSGPAPRGRARHAAVVYDDKLFIIGGMSGNKNTTILDDICYLDMTKMEWSRTWRFTPRFDHSCWVWNKRIWIFGGLTEGMERASDLWWLDFSQTACIESFMSVGSMDGRSNGSRNYGPNYQATASGAGGSGYAANSSSVQSNQASNIRTRKAPMAPGLISSLSFVAGQSIPPQALGTHFHVFSSGCLLDFVTPAVTGQYDTSLCALELDTMRWEKLADGKELFGTNYRWHYCALNQDGTQAWLLGCPTEAGGAGAGGVNPGEYLSDVLSIDLGKLGLLGNSLANDIRADGQKLPASDTQMASNLTPIGGDLARMFDKAPETASGADFIITAEAEEVAEETSDEDVAPMNLFPGRTSRPIHVHRLILEARWPHFARMIAAQMEEFHTKKLHIPEPFRVVRAFLQYLYTDSINGDGENGPSLDDVAGMLVMASCYDMPRLRLLCRNRLGRELDVEHAAVIWDKAGIANDDWLKKRAARFCLTYWGRVVRTIGFQSLKRDSMNDLCLESELQGRIVGVEELDTLGGFSNPRYGPSASREYRSRRLGSAGTQAGEGGDDEDDEEGMELT